MTGPMMMDTKGDAVGAVDNSRTTFLSVVLVALSAISGFLFGYDTGVVSGAMLLIRPAFQLDNLWHEMIVSGTVLGALVFSLAGGFSTDRYGRRTTILFAAVMFTAGSVMLGCALNKEMMLCGRIIVGVGVGLGSATTPMYIAESAAPKHRGIMVSCYVLGVTFGQFAASIICAVLAEMAEGWRWMLGLAGAPSALMLIGFLFLPESPRWLVMQGRISDAEKVLQRLRGSGASIAEEVKAIREASEKQTEEMKLYSNVLAQMFKSPSVLKALLVGCILQGYQQLIGINTVMYYSASIIEMAGVGSHALVLWVSAGVAGANFFCTIIGLYLIDRVGRRPLILASIAGSCLSLVVLGVGFVLMNTQNPVVQDLGDAGCRAMQSCRVCVTSELSCGYCFTDTTSSCWARNISDYAVGGPCSTSLEDFTWASNWCPSDYSWIAILALVMYLFFFAPGMGPLPWVINSEIHVNWARGVSACITSSTNWLFNFIVSMVFLSLIEAMTAAGTFFLFAAIAFTGFLVIWFLLPETKGIPLEEVENLFRRKMTLVQQPPSGGDFRPKEKIDQA